MSHRKNSHPLHPTLEETEGELESALDEVCEDTEVQKKDTGELIRVEESLAIAAVTAKKAISLRKRIKADQGGPPPLPEGD